MTRLPTRLAPSFGDDWEHAVDSETELAAAPPAAASAAEDAQQRVPFWVLFCIAAFIVSLS